MGGLVFLVWIVSAATAAEAAAAAATVNPMIRVANNNLEIVIPQNTTASLVVIDAGGNPIGSPIPLATFSDVANLTSQLSATTQSLQAMQAAMSTMQTGLQAQLDRMNQTFQANVVATVTTMLQQNVTLFQNVVNNMVTSPGSGSNALANALKGIVYVSNLSVVGPEITNVVSNMILPGASNALATQLNSKLNASQTCQCFNPASLQAVNSSVLASTTALAALNLSFQSVNASVANLQQQAASIPTSSLALSLAALNSTLQTVQQSIAVYGVDLRNLSVIDAHIQAIFVCSAAPAPIAYGSVATCAGLFYTQVCVDTGMCVLSPCMLGIADCHLAIIRHTPALTCTSVLPWPPTPTPGLSASVIPQACIPACLPGYYPVSNYTCISGKWQGAPSCLRKLSL